MRWAVIVLAGLAAQVPAWGQLQQPPLTPRYGQEFDTDGYSQNTPRDTLASVIKAIERRKVEYLLAHLTDPVFVDERVAQVHRGSFPAMVQECIDKLRDDPESIDLLRRFLKDGEFEQQDAEGRATLKGSRERLYFKRYEARWFLDNAKRK